MQTMDNYNFAGKKAIIRVDFNVPLNADYKVTDDTRITATLPTINKILADKGAVILMSHLGRPKDAPENKYSLVHIVEHLSELLGQKVKFANDCIGNEAVEKAAALKAGEVLLLENLRFHKQETKGDKDFAGKLAALADVYVNDAFGTAHRAHASTTIIADFFPNDKMFGYLISKELYHIDQVIRKSAKPFTAILGGAKVSTKIQIIEHLMDKVDNLIIGGGMTYTFIKAMGGKTGASIVEDDFIETAREVLKKADEKKVKIYIPIDNVAADKFDNDANKVVCPTDKIDDGWMGLDIADKTIAIFAEVIKNSKTILWNGPMGVFEMENFQKGTVEIAHAIVEATKNGAYTLVGGGDSVAAVNKYNLADEIGYVSTGGGAMLEYIEGKELPGITAIRGE